MGEPAGYSAAFVEQAMGDPAAAVAIEACCVRAASARAFARAALAGNQSDGYGGRTLAVTVRDSSAVAHVEPGTGVKAPDGLVPLVEAAVRRLAPSEPFRGVHASVLARSVWPVPRWS